MKFVDIGLAAAVLLVLAAPLGAAELPANLRSMLEKSASLGLDRFPIGFWNYTNLTAHGQYMDEAEVEEWADAGFTVTMTPSFDPGKPEQVEHMRRMLEWADARGMKLIICDPRTYGPHHGEATDPVPVPADHAQKIAAALADFRGSPAVFGFHIGDEPNRFNNDAYFESYRMLGEAAPDLHPFMNLLPYWHGAEGYVGYETWGDYLDAAVRKSNLDFLCYDCYAQMNPGTSGWDMYYENLREYREAAQRGGVPFWTTILSVGHFRYRCPNYNELRWQFNTAIASGANGILWFFYYMRQPHDNYRLSPVDENWDRTQTYYDIRRFQKAFHRHYGDLFLRLAPTRVTFTPEAYGGGEVFTPNELVAEVTPDKEGHPLLLGQFVDIEGRRYVMLVNNSTDESVNAALTFPGADVKIHSWNWSGQEHEGGAYCAGRTSRSDAGLRVSHWLAPGQEAVYRVDSEAIRAAAVAVK
ncbi:MAG: hypothetical protein JSV65_12785 [Armatimonadota bacterium]|nr:MAG: hypothetical protein JSV65_12785 [Armatimonadota bacterium]